jgi:hypothetical protein
MGATFKVNVQGVHTVFDDDGHALSPGWEYSVKHGPLVDELIDSGFLTTVQEADEVQPEPRTKSPRAQATEPETSQEN